MREIARAFSLKNADRAALKQMLRELADEGKVERRRKKLHHAGALPAVVLADITDRDARRRADRRPGRMGRGAHGEAPRIRIHVPRKARPAEVPGVGDRVLTRAEETGEDGDAIRHTGRVIKVLDRARQRQIGVFRALPNGAGRLVPVDKKQAGRELDIPAGATADAKDGDLVAVELMRQGRFGLPTARVKERLGSLKSERAVSLIAIHAHDIPHEFRPRDAGRGRSRAARRPRSRPRGLAHGAARHHRSERRQGPRRRGLRRARHRSEQPRRLHHHRRDRRRRRATCAPGSALDREALVRGNSVYFPDRVVPMLPERISNDLCSLRPNEDRAALAVRMVIGADGRKRGHTFHRVLMRSAAKLHYAQAQDAVDGRTDDDHRARCSHR